MSAARHNIALNEPERKRELRFCVGRELAAFTCSDCQWTYPIGIDGPRIPRACIHEMEAAFAAHDCHPIAESGTPAATTAGTTTGRIVCY